MKPSTLPNNPCFSSGPCAKRPGWNIAALHAAPVGRSHRSKIGKARLAEVIARSKNVLGLPSNYVLGIVPASDTGAIETAIDQVLAQNADKVAEYCSGKEKLFGFFIGQILDLFADMVIDEFPGRAFLLVNIKMILAAFFQNARG